MKLSTNLKTIAPMTGIAALLLWGIAGQYQSEGAGSLTPPPGEPTPVMPTLEEIAAKVDTIPGSGGRNFALRYQSNVQVWSNETGSLTTSPNVTGLAQVVESDGNFCARGNSGGAAWDRRTGVWKVVTGISGADARQLIISNGNFLMIGTSKATAWSRVTGEWTTRTISNPGTVNTSNGNFLIQSGTTRLYIWNQRDGSWKEVTPSNNFQGVIDAGN